MSTPDDRLHLPPTGAMKPPPVVPPWVHAYRKRGFKLVFYERGQKFPTDDGWNTREYTDADYIQGGNVGIICGVEISPGTFLVDVDYDWSQSYDFAKALLPETEFEFGRISRHIS